MPDRAVPSGSDPTQLIQIAADAKSPDSSPAESGDPTAPEVASSATAPPARRARRWRAKRVLLVTAVVILALVGAALVGGGWYLRSVNASVERIDAFDDVPEDSRPEVAVPDAKNILLLGSDSRDPQSDSGSRSDTIIVAHLPKGRQSAQLVSIPRDTWLHIPPSRDGRNGDTDAKINAAYAWGGVSLLVQTVEGFTGLRMDHVVIIDFAGFKEIVDALGGVELNIEESFTTTHPLKGNRPRHFTKGPQTVDGAAALDYARERYAFEDGDFARIRHQQQVIKAIIDKAANTGILTNPAQLNSLIRATSDAVSVDNTLSIFDMAMELRHLRGASLTFLTSPNRGTGKVGTQSVVFPDTERASVLYDALRRDAISEIPADLVK